MSNLQLRISLIPIFGTIAFGIALPILAHKVETSEDVGATLHIEPNDTPKAEEPSQAWFALTREGGDQIPLSKCDCKLSIYPEPKSSQPILQPTLKPLSTEGYKNIPSAEVTFPKIGIYNLEITGKPIAGEDFKPFKFNFKVTVAASIPQVPTSSETQTTQPSSNQLSENQLVQLVIGLSIASLGSSFLILKILRKRN